MPDAFYERDGDRFRATELTRGPWDPGSQHAGPPSALIGREIERLEDAEEFQVGRITFEILRPVPIGPVEVEARVVRPGRRVQLVEASLSDGEQELIRARAWRIRTASLDLPAEVTDLGEPPPGPEQGSEPEFFPTGQDAGYHTAMEWRSLSGGFLEPGPAKFWMRQLVPLVAGEEPSPLQRTLVIADVGNGISAVLDPRQLPLHQRRPHRPPGADAGGRVDLRRRRHPPAPERDRQRRVGALRPPRAGSAAPSRRCSSPSARGQRLGAALGERPALPAIATAIAVAATDGDRGREQEGALVVGQRRRDARPAARRSRPRRRRRR